MPKVDLLMRSLSVVPGRQNNVLFYSMSTQSGCKDAIFARDDLSPSINYFSINNFESEIFCNRIS